MADFTTETAVQKEMARNIQSDEKQEPTTEITLLSKVIIHNQRTNKGLPRPEKLQEFVATKSVLHEMIKGIL